MSPDHILYRVRRWQVALLVLLAVALVGLFIILSRGDGARSAIASSSSISALEHYQVLRRAATPSDAATADLPPGAQVLRRQATGNSRLSQWISLGGGKVCVTVQGAATGATGQGTYRACNSESRLEASNQLVATSSYSSPPGSPAPTPGVSSLVAGLAPDGVSAVTVTFDDGSTRTAPVVDNGFHLTISGAPKSVKSFSWVDASGNAHTEV